jgi:hypothetical protein
MRGRIARNRNGRNTAARTATHCHSFLDITDGRKQFPPSSTTSRRCAPTRRLSQPVSCSAADAIDLALNARPPRRTGWPSFSRRRSATNRRNGPNANAEDRPSSIVSLSLARRSEATLWVRVSAVEAAPAFRRGARGLAVLRVQNLSRRSCERHHEAVASFAANGRKIQMPGDGSISWPLYLAKGSGTRRSCLGVTRTDGDVAWAPKSS